MIKAEIITIGDEILIGQIVDTNSAWIAEQLNLIGIKVFQITSISDDSLHIMNALQEASSRADLILITGGLGPTKDDITKYTLAKYFKSEKMLLHEPSLENIRSMFVKRNIPLTELNIKQAEVPDNCTVILNTSGTAPGMWFEHKDKIFVSMPGVPHEMKTMMKEVLRLLSHRYGESGIYHKSLMTFGVPESLLAEKIEKWELALPNNIKLAYLPNLGTGVKLRLSAFGQQKEILAQQVKEEFAKLLPIVGSAFYGYEPDNLESVVGKFLKERNLTLATAESCTGGNIAHKITTISGSSAYFKGSIVAYSNQTKINVLGVDSAIIDKYGAVSSETVQQMAIGVKQLLQTDYAIATSGIAGPTGGTTVKPVGLCYFAIAGPNSIKTYSQIFTSDRTGNILRATSAGLNYLRLFLLNE